MKPCIGLVVPALELGGGVPAVARFIKDLVLRADRFDLNLISLATSAQDTCSVGLAQPGTWIRGPITSEREWQGLRFTHVGATFGELEFQRYRSRNALTEAVSGCDILQVVCGSPASAYAVCGLGKPVAVQCATRAKVERRKRNANATTLRGRWRKAMTAITDRMDDLALRSVSAIQVENPWMYEYARNINRDREVDLRYAPPGVDTVTFHPAMTRDLDLDAYVLCVGRLDDDRKNIGLLLEAYALLPSNIRERLRLVLAGQAGPPAGFWKRSAALGLKDRIAFIDSPKRDELVALYQKASIFALPSDEEGLGVVLLEAMACGIPVVSTRSGGPDGIITDGDDGFLVPLDDARALADRIALLSADATRNVQMGGKGRLTIEQRFAEEVAGETFLDIWDRMLVTARSLPASVRPSQ